ncbi:MAG: DEAD/DEAH box helicase [Euryarchaeota archaeon]|nr:DEAD/DEAH box helicase [Euryarchaeota archaeon]
MDFEAFKLNPRIAASIKAMGDVEPTPIQAQALPAVLEGRDVMGRSQTGTGKTAVVVLPILQRLIDRQRGPVRALVVAPTRELAEQIHLAVIEMGRMTGVRSVTAYGGVGMEPQVRGLRNGADIVVAGPRGNWVPAAPRRACPAGAAKIYPLRSNRVLERSE